MWWSVSSECGREFLRTGVQRNFEAGIAKSGSRRLGSGRRLQAVDFLRTDSLHHHRNTTSLILRTLEIPLRHRQVDAEHSFHPQIPDFGLSRCHRMLGESTPTEQLPPLAGRPLGTANRAMLS